MVVTNWPMWVVGLTLFVDGMDQYIVRGSSNQIKTAFGVGDTARSGCSSRPSSW